MHLQLLLSAGILASITMGTPGIHGAAVTGMQGIGVSTPSAAAVAAVLGNGLPPTGKFSPHSFAMPASAVLKSQGPGPPGFPQTHRSRSPF